MSARIISGAIAIDTSAIVAIAKSEPEIEPFTDFFAVHDCIIGAATLVETRMVLEKHLGDDTWGFIDDILTWPRVKTADFTIDMYRTAATAFLRYGKGRDNKAKLNYGDCLSYAVAKVYGVPLLFKGSDFSHTDIEPAYRP